jgi:hypothetical protein
MARYRIVLDFEGPPPPPATLPGGTPRFYAQLVRHLLALDPNALGHSLTRAEVATAFAGTRLLAVSLVMPEP